MNYKYILDTSPRKYKCKGCNKSTLVKFINTETGELLSSEFGRCDRESNCGFFKRPKTNLTSDFQYQYEPPKPISYHHYDRVTESGINYKNNNFVLFITNLFGKESAQKAVKKYLIGTSKYWKGATVFWQIDDNQKVRHGKIMLYNSDNGKRKKDEVGKAFISSVRCILKLKDFNLKQCLFGLHLVNEIDTKIIGLVESEKTAIMLSMFKPDYTWLATGSKGGLKYEFLKPIRDYKIICFPDKSEYNDWSFKATELNSLGFNVRVNDYIENTPCKAGTDLADIIAEQKQLNLLESNVAPVKVNSDILLNKDFILNKMTFKNPNLLKLIDTFGLRGEIQTWVELEGKAEIDNSVDFDF